MDTVRFELKIIDIWSITIRIESKAFQWYGHGRRMPDYRWVKSDTMVFKREKEDRKIINKLTDLHKNCNC